MDSVFFVLVIANKPRPLPYLDALIPKDQDLESWGEEEVAKQMAATEPAKTATPESLAKGLSPEGQQTAPKPGQEIPVPVTETADGEGPIDNPYLRPIKMPKLKGAKKTKW